MDNSKLIKNRILRPPQNHRRKKKANASHHHTALNPRTTNSTQRVCHLAARMNTENIIWNDELDATRVSASSAPSYRPPQFDANTPLSAHQKSLLKIYHLHRFYEVECMNAIVDLDITVQRERDEAGVKFVKQQLGHMQEELARHREGRRRVEAKTRREEERLRRVLEKRKGQGKEKTVPRRQLEEMEKFMEKRKQRVMCLR